MELPGRRLAIVAALGAVVVVALVVVLLPREAVPAGPMRIPGEQIDLRIQVLNATDVAGLARAWTLRLRRAGFDIVGYGTNADQSLDSSRLLIRSARAEDSEYLDSLVRVLGIDTAFYEPDEDLLLDVTLLVGRDLATLEFDP